MRQLGFDGLRVGVVTGHILFAHRSNAILSCYCTHRRGKRPVQCCFKRSVTERAVSVWTTCQVGDLFPSAGEALGDGFSQVAGNPEKKWANGTLPAFR